jgi:glycosyltransferase involved in cell wall biosynthesis
MKVTGVTIIRNAINNDYPVIESIKSVLPVVDEFVVLVGDCSDETESIIKQIQSPKIRIEHSTWDLSLRTGGTVLAVETNKVLDLVSKDTDWIFYIQADEVIHEKDHENIRKAMEEFLNDKRIDGLLFHYRHFYGTYDYVGNSRKWYNVETRIIRNNPNIRSYRDAQGFRKQDNTKLQVAQIKADVHHYGWVKDPKQMKIKQKNVAGFWNSDDASLQQFLETEDFFDYSQFDSLKKFNGTHPLFMQERIQQKNWHVELDIKKNNLKFTYKLLHIFEKLTGIRLFTFTNHKIVAQQKS